MKVPAKQFFSLLLFITVFQLPRTHAQAPAASRTKISPVLTVVLPDSFSSGSNEKIITYAGGDTLESCEVSFFDTVIVKIADKYDFELSLKSFVAGKFAGEVFKPYDLQLTDTVISHLPGLFIRGKTDEKSLEIRKFFSFTTIADSKCYWFFYYFKNPSSPTAGADSFFTSIQFSHQKIPEAGFAMESFKRNKPAGKTWYLSPDLEAPMPPREEWKEKPEDPSFPPKPPLPPINRKWLVQATKLASDYTLNRAQADKKYKSKSPLVVQGVVKEIRETNDKGITIVVLDGAPSKADVQCEVLNSFNIRNLRKGMRATFDARCEGINGNITLTQCLYIEKPTYE